MLEHELINIIKNKIGNEYIGDDCAYLKDLDIVVSQDNLVEDIHFKRKWCTAFQLGYKSIIVNISDILASGAIPKYITIGLSLPNNISNEFVNEFYDGAISALNGAVIIGGDITGSTDKIVISITVIGNANSKNISSRKNAKDGYIVVTKGNYGTSAAGLLELYNQGNNNTLIKEHLEPQIDYEFAQRISTNITEPYAMMDTSDGLADALFKIAAESNTKIKVDYNKIPHLKNITKEQVLFGGEDYNLVAAIPAKYINLLNDAIIIGKVEQFDGIRLDISGNKYSDYNELNVYNHFEDR